MVSPVPYAVDHDQQRLTWMWVMVVAENARLPIRVEVV